MLSTIWNELLYRPLFNALIGLAHLTAFDLGLAIILLTIIIKLILLAPQAKAIKSQRQMQAIQPQLKAIQTKYKGDQQRIGLETMALYKEHQINPMSSCLPLLVQLPVLLALYRVFLAPLNGETQALLYPFFASDIFSKIHTTLLGLVDLTQPERVVLPITVGILQYFQMATLQSRQKDTATATPSEMETANKVMLYFMPLMIAYFSYSLAAGLALYWAISTLFSLIQQLVIMRSEARQLSANN